MDLVTYVSRFSENMRDTIVDEITKAALMKKAMQTDAGKVIINTAIDGIHQKVMAILGSCSIDSLTDRMAKVERLTTEVVVMHDLIRAWAEIIVNGEKHKDAMK